MSIRALLSSELIMRRLTSSEKDLLASIEQQLSARRRTVITPDIVEQATHLIRSMTDPRPGLHELVGPVCTTSDIVAWLGISRPGINKAVRTNRILAVQSPTTMWYYPTWQLMANHSVIDDMSEVLGRLRGRVHQLTAATWFQRPLEVLEQTTPAQWMLDGHDLHTVVGAAEAFATAEERRPSPVPLFDPEIQATSL